MILSCIAAILLTRDAYDLGIEPVQQLQIDGFVVDSLAIYLVSSKP